MRVVVLGAGHVGQAITRMLVGSGDYDVTLVDKSNEALGAAAAGVKTVTQSADTQGAIEDQLGDCDAVVNALPFHLAPTVAAAAARSDCHYLDLTEDVKATRAIRELADGADRAFIPQCGLAPGFIGIAAHALASRFEEVHELKMRVGALPAYPTNALKYNLTWSVEGLINEYCHPCEGILNGERVEFRPLEGLEHLYVDGVQYEAFNTSGGLGTLCETLHGSVRSLDYKTIRYPGHRDLMKVLLEELGLKSKQDVIVRILRDAIPSTEHDVVIIFVSVTGMRKGRFVQDAFVRKIFGGEQLGGTALQISTAASLCTVVDMLRLGQIPSRGFVRQESIDFDAYMENRFAEPYRSASLVRLP
jgi:saccharopine dehydrogenase-like NADP-dependent oxidoreductase